MHSASADHTTADMIGSTKREIGLWDVIRLLAGLVAGAFFIIGVIKLIILGEDPATTPLTQREGAEIATGVTMTVCGLFACWLSVSAQRAADKRAEQRAELSVVVARVAVNATRLDELSREVHDLVTEEKEQREHSAKARANVAKIQEDLTDLRVGMAEMAQRMPSETSLLATLKAYIDTLFRAFQDHEDAAKKDAQFGGYMEGVRTRLNGSKPHLHAIESDR